MSIEQQGQSQGPMRNAAGEEMHPTQLKNGEVRLITQTEYHQLVDQGEIYVPHSNEPVVRPFDKTSLQFAVDTGLTPTPESLAAMPTAPNRRKRVAIAIAGATAGVIAAGIGVGVAASNNDSENSHPGTTSSSSPNPSGETAQTPSGVETSIEPVSISAELLNNPEALAEAYMDIEEAWIHYGKDKLPVSLDDHDPNVQNDDYIEEAIGDSDERFASILLGDDWKSNPTLVAYFEVIKRHHYNELTFYLRTIPEISQDPANLEAFNSTREITDTRVTSSLSDTQTILDMDYLYHTNGSLNKAPEYIEGGDFDGTTGTVNFTFVAEGDYITVANWNNVPG